MTLERRMELAGDGFVSPKEAADHLGVCVTMIYKLIGARALESVKIGKARRIPRRSLTEYAANLLAEQEIHAVKAS